MNKVSALLAPSDLSGLFDLITGRVVMEKVQTGKFGNLVLIYNKWRGFHPSNSQQITAV